MGKIVTRSETGTNIYTTEEFTRNVKLLWVDVDYTSDATAGNRHIRLALVNKAAAIVGGWRPDVLQAAGNVYYYEFLPGIGSTSAASPQVDEVDVGLPQVLIIPANYKLQIQDVNGVSSGDSMNIDFQYEEV